MSQRGYDTEARVLQRWIIDNGELWRRALGMGERLTETEFFALGQEFSDQGLHCAYIMLITVYWDFAEPVARERLQTVLDLVTEWMGKEG